MHKTTKPKKVLTFWKFLFRNALTKDEEDFYTIAPLNISDLIH